MRATQNDRRSVTRDDARREGTELDRKYGRIGISAVAAAARYCSGAKSPSSTAEALRPRKRREDDAAA
jgi:hypothetical protein